jgi:hypothetical protein
MQRPRIPEWVDYAVVILVIVVIIVAALILLGPQVGSPGPVQNNL